jgi:nicotinate-nucleotide pyrophosphorylase (carboxylating)
MKDIRDDIFCSIMERSVTAAILADDAGIIAGTKAAFEKASELGLTVDHMAEEGRSVNPGDEIIRISGNPKQIAMAEEHLMGCMAKPSGVATAARRCVRAADEKISIVCGSWKKMPAEIKEALRSAIVVGGADSRICCPPFIYLDKNYVRMLGGVEKSLEALAHFADYTKVIQIKGDRNDIAWEAIKAAQCRANIIFIDSGNHEDIKTVSMALDRNGLRANVKIAFGGNVKMADIETLKTMDVDILDIGKEIIDAPLLDMKMEVV